MKSFAEIQAEKQRQRIQKEFQCCEAHPMALSEPCSVCAKQARCPCSTPGAVQVPPTA